MCFTGHRELNGCEAELSPLLDRVLQRLYEQGYRRFWNGAALGFDQLAAEAVLRLRARHSDVQLLMAVPCESQSRRWSQEQCLRYERILAEADECRVLSKHYYNGCMNVRNRFMVDRSSVCVCYLNQPKGGTMSTVAYAVSKQLASVNLADELQYRRFLATQAV